MVVIVTTTMILMNVNWVGSIDRLMMIIIMRMTMRIMNMITKMMIMMMMKIELKLIGWAAWIGWFAS